jgi:hypothetical protein
MLIVVVSRQKQTHTERTKATEPLQTNRHNKLPLPDLLAMGWDLLETNITKKTKKRGK